MRSITIVKLLAIALMVGTLPLAAQTQTRLTGTVTDDTGSVIPGARITVSNINTGVTLETETNASGSYNFPFVASGQYELICEFEGFKTHSQSGIVLETGTVRGVDIELQIGDVTETIQVEAAAPLLETESSTVGQFIERDTVFNMPLASRRSASLVRLLGNVTYRNEGGAEALPFFSMAGGRSRNQMWTLDGTVIQNMSLGIAQLGLNPPAESLQEFKVEQSNYSAEYGRAGGGFIVMTTRSGTNDFHGAAYEFFRNQAIDTRTFFAPGKAPLRYNIFGASAGGPIAKNKSFYFFNYEGGRRRNGVTYSSDDVPHVPEVGGDFSNRAGLALKDPLSDGEVFGNNRIPASRIDALGRQIASWYPAPNVGGDLSKAPANNFVNNASNALTQDFYTVKLDHNFGNNDRVYGRFQFSRNPLVVAAVYPNEFADPRAGTRANRHTNVTGAWIHHFSPTLIQDVRINWGTPLAHQPLRRSLCRQERRTQHWRRQSGGLATHNRQRAHSARRGQSREDPDTDRNLAVCRHLHVGRRKPPDSLRRRMAFRHECRRLQFGDRGAIQLRQPCHGSRTRRAAAWPCRLWHVDRCGHSGKPH